MSHKIGFLGMPVLSVSSGSDVYVPASALALYLLSVSCLKLHTSVNAQLIRLRRSHMRRSKGTGEQLEESWTNIKRLDKQA